MSAQLFRSFKVAEIQEEPTGRTLLVKCLPWETPTTVQDALPGGKMGPAYQESFARGSFRGAEKAPHRVSVLLGTHEPASIFENVGHATLFEDRADGLFATLRIDESVFGDAALAKTRSGGVTHVSVGGKFLRSAWRNGILVREAAFLDHLALTNRPQYKTAEILEVRALPQHQQFPRLDDWRRRRASHQMTIK